MELLMSIVLNLGEDEFYRVNRYETHLAVALINSDDKSIFSNIEKNIRQTDIVQQLDSNLIVVFLTHTDYEASLKCIEKVQRRVDFTYTIAEYRDSRIEFIEKLFSDNKEKLI